MARTITAVAIAVTIKVTKNVITTAIATGKPAHVEKKCSRWIYCTCIICVQVQNCSSHTFALNKEVQVIECEGQYYSGDI